MVLWKVASRETPFKEEEPFMIVVDIQQGKREEITANCPAKIPSLINSVGLENQKKGPRHSRSINS
jgi:hypothetical protein